MLRILKKKKWIVSLVVLISAFALLEYISLEAMADEQNKKETIQEEEAYEVTGPLTLEVTLKRDYLDGETSVEVVQETIWSMEDFWAHYADWELIEQSEGALTFKKEVDDISPLLKANGYFGISEDGILTIYDGKPESQNVIQSFFQIDIEKLESRQQEELKNGIPVISKDKYNEIIQSYKNYSLQQ